jgi:LacI family transcriptional regulator
MIHRSVTIADIARQLNLSTATIDRALNNRGNVAEKTRERILQAAREMGYSPNRSAKHLSKQTQCCIGVSYMFPDWFAEQINEGIQQAFADFKDLGLTLVVRDAARNTEEQISQIRQMRPMLHGLAVAPWESSRFGDFIDELVDDGLPVVTFNNDIATSKRLFYVGCDYVAAGRLCGELIAKLAEGPGEVGIIIRNERLANIEQRITGFRGYVSNNSDLRVVGPFKTTNSQEETIAAVQNLLDIHPELVGLFVASDNLALVGYALQKLGKDEEITLVGYDLNDRHYRLIQEQVIQAVVCQEPFYQGYYPIKVLFDYITEKTWPARTEIVTRLEIIMKENLEFYHSFRKL